MDDSASGRYVHLHHCLKAKLSINAVDRLIGAARKLVSHFSHSVVASEELKRRRAQVEINKRKLEFAIRWNFCLSVSWT